jgi:integrase
MLTTGLRLGEVKALTWGDWYREFNVFHINKAVKNDETIGMTKNEKERIVLILDKALQMLNGWESEALFTSDDDLIFCCNRFKPINRKTCSEHFKKGLSNAKIEIGERNLVIHSLRHTMNTKIRRCFDDETLRLFTGHLDVKMTDAYDHPTVEDDIRKVMPFRSRMEEAWSTDFKSLESSVTP